MKGNNYYMCDCCYEVFSGDALKHDAEYETPCPKIECDGYVFAIDEQMILPIRILNTKRYSTNFCCSGHAFSDYSGGYISFLSDDWCLDDYIPDSCPQGWRKDGNAIRYDFSKGATLSQKLKEQHKKIDALMKWCEMLPDNPKMDVD